MKVVNLRKDKYTIYIGRPGKGQDGPFGNPVCMNGVCCICSEIHEDRESTLPCYELYLRKRLKNSTAFREQFLNLEDSDVLGCFCKPDSCHGEIMIKVWEEIKNG